MAPLDGKARAGLPDSSFAYIDSKGRRRLPINDAAHVRNALARFQRTVFEDEAARERVRQRLLRAALRYRIAPVGFLDGQLRQERRQAEIKARAAKFAILPRGRVTFLLADIEGSTKLAAKLGDDFPALLAQIWQVLRAVVRRAGGDEVDVRGDEYFAVFRRPVQALNAAIGIQLGMESQEWPGRRKVRVRIGLHTGQASVADAAYAGITVHTAARVCSAGHGGQILLSASAQQALIDDAGAGIGFRALGRYALAGLPEPEPLFQVQAPGLLTAFPRLRAKLAVTRSPAAESTLLLPLD